MKLFFHALILVLAIPSLLEAQAEDDWVKLAPVGGGFSVLLPAKAKEQVDAKEDFVSHMFSVTTDKAIYFALYGDYPPSVRFNPATQLVANRDDFLKGLKATLTNSKRITFKGHAGIEFAAENDRASFNCRVYLFGNRAHLIAVAVFNGEDDTENVKRFFDSFTFTGGEGEPRKQ